EQRALTNERWTHRHDASPFLRSIAPERHPSASREQMLDLEPRQPHLVVLVPRFHRSSLAGTGVHRGRSGASLDISSARRGFHAAYAEEHYSKGEEATIDLKQVLAADEQSPVAAQPSEAAFHFVA